MGFTLLFLREKIPIFTNWKPCYQLRDLSKKILYLHTFLGSMMSTKGCAILILHVTPDSLFLSTKIAHILTKITTLSPIQIIFFTSTLKWQVCLTWKINDTDGFSRVFCWVWDFTEKKGGNDLMSLPNGVA